MKLISIVCVCLLFVAPAQAGEFARAQLELKRGARVAGGAPVRETLRVDLRSSKFMFRGEGVSGEGQDEALVRALKIQLLLGEDGLRPLGKTASGSWSYVLRLFRPGSAPKTIKGALAGPTFKRGWRRLPTALRAMLRIRGAALEGLAPQIGAARVARLKTVTDELFPPQAGVLVTRIRHQRPSSAGRGVVTGVRVFLDGRVELREGITKADLSTRFRFRVSTDRCEALAAALEGAEPSSSLRSSQKLFHLVFTSPRHAPVVLSGTEAPKGWDAVDVALDTLLSKLELRGQAAGKGGRELRKTSGSQEHWLKGVDQIHLAWDVDQALARELSSAPTALPLALVGHYSLPRGQAYAGERQPRFVVTEVLERPRLLTGIEQRLKGLSAR